MGAKGLSRPEEISPRSNRTQQMAVTGKCIVVDAYCTGRHLAPVITELGFDCIHVQSSDRIAPVYSDSFQPTTFRSNLKGWSDLDALSSTLEKYSPDYIIAGSDTGLELADYLSDRLGLPSNGTRKSEARRSKYLMHEILRQLGLKCTRQTRASSLNEVLEWRELLQPAAVVLKPERSSGSDGVTICKSAQEIRCGFERIYYRLNALSFVNDTVIAQVFLEGPEYIVNTVSAEGTHFIAEVWRSNRRHLGTEGTTPYMQELLPPDHETVKAVTPYVEDVLDAFEIRVGAAQIELVVTAAGPVLIEINPRMHEMIIPQSVAAATGTNHVNLTVEAYTAPDKIKARAERPYGFDKRMLHVFLGSPADGILLDMPGLDDIKRLDSFYCAHICTQLGAPISKTKNKFTVCGVIDLVADNEFALTRDYQLLREIEATSLFRIQE